MDAERFDRLTRLLTTRWPRRPLVALAAAVAVPLAVRAAGVGACDPDCAGKACGPDGCGGSCGACPAGSQCLDGIGVCVTDPPACGLVGESCGATTACCDLLTCVDGMCTLPGCVPDGGPCGPGAPCCTGSSCITDVCVRTAPTCVPTGASCQEVDCCEKADTCIIGKDGSHTCTPAAPLTPPCAHAGQRVAQQQADCCTRLHEEDGRCVVNRWDRCDRKHKGRRAPCESGTKCRGGRNRRKGVPVCVPV